MSKLDQVHPDLVKVILAAQADAAAQGHPFIVVYGLRTVEAQRKALASGNSTTMHSRHLPNKDGVSCAVDLAATTNGAIDWAAGHEAMTYGAIAGYVKAAAHRLGIPVEWGGDWNTFKDWGHFQLPWATYP